MKITALNYEKENSEFCEPIEKNGTASLVGRTKKECIRIFLFSDLSNIDIEL